MYHVIVTGSRPVKVGNKFQPMPEDNIRFIRDTLSRLDSTQYAALYHGMAAGVDTVVDDYAFNNRIRVRQFPAYWFDPTKEGNVDKRAGLFRNEAMIRAAVDATYNHPSDVVILLAFHNTKELKDSRGTAHAVTYANKKGLDVRTFALPVLKDLTPNATQTTQEQIHPF